MKFEDVQSLWNDIDKKQDFVVNDQALRALIHSKKTTAHRVTHYSELLLISVNLASGLFILSINLANEKSSGMLFVLAGWMLLTCMYVLVNRLGRSSSYRQFDRSMRGELNNAIAVATYQVRLSTLMRWNIVPIALFIILGLLEIHMPYWAGAIVLVFAVLTFFASAWEHGVYQDKNTDLERLRDKLTNEGTLANS